MEQKRLMTRREFIRLSTLAGAGAAIAACAPAATATQAPEPTTAPAATSAPATAAPVATTAPMATSVPKPTMPPAAQFKQAPELDTLVTAGTLPPVDERLPANPWVADTLEQIGVHGGLIHRGYTGASDRWGPTKIVDKGLVWYDKNLVSQPHYAESWTVNSDGTEWTFKLRKGMKWSDGVDFTSADLRWNFDNVLQNNLLQASTPSIWTTGVDKTWATLTTPDDYTFTINYADPKPLLLLLIGRSGTPHNMFCPSHYLEQFHADLTKDKAALDAIVTASGQASWDLYWLNVAERWDQNPDLPVLGPWRANEALGEDIFTMIRNPYFCGVDSEGNQLPYVDQIQHRQYSSAAPEVFNLWITNGEIDFQARHVSSAVADYTVFKQSESKGDYKVFKGISSGHQAVQLNLACKNAKLAEVFNDRAVRIALSIAIDRDTINELVFGGLGTPRQYSPISLSPQYYAKLSNAYINYDPDGANKMLDEAGYTAKDSDGYRMYKDGSETITFTVEGTAAQGTPDEDSMQQIVKMWAAVGIKCVYKYVERALYSQHFAANDIEGSFWGGDRTVLPLSTEAIIFRGTQVDRPWADGFGLWYNNHDDPNGVEPPQDHFIWKIWDIWDKVAVEADPDKQNALFQQILDVWAEEIPMVGVLGELPSFCIVKNGLKNFIDGFPNDDPTGDEEIYCTETYTWDDPSQHPVM